MKMLVATILVGIILTSLVLITTVGNVLVCLSVILVRKLRKPQNYLLVSLAVSDLFVSLFVMPFAIVFELNEASWPLSDSLCDLYVSGKFALYFQVIIFKTFVINCSKFVVTLVELLFCDFVVIDITPKLGCFSL